MNAEATSATIRRSRAVFALEQLSARRSGNGCIARVRYVLPRHKAAVFAPNHKLRPGQSRVPLLVRWPGGVPAGLVSTAPVTSVDLLPTLLELTGRPLATGRVVDGISLAAHLRGSPAPARDAIYWHYPHYHSAGVGGPASAIRAGDWKLIEYHEHSLTGTGRAPELFHLAKDPGESRNLAGAEPARTRELLAKLAAYRTATGAQLPTVNPRYDPAAAGKKKRASGDFQ